jgi:hypothetical protein
MIAVVLLYVGAVLLVNGIWILGSAMAQPESADGPGRRAYLLIGNREIFIINVFTGAVGFLVAMFSIFRAAPSSVGDLNIQFGGLVLLFAFTYLWVATNQVSGADGRGLGWFCLFVAITALPTAIIVLSGSKGHAWPVWLGLNWVAWAVLWFLFFLLLALKMSIAKLVGVLTILVAIFTAWIPGYLLLLGYLSGT